MKGEPAGALVHARLRICALALTALLVLTPLGSALAQSYEPCAAPIGRIVSVQGTVEMRRATNSAWQPVKQLDVRVCVGDFVRAGLLSRAAIYVSPETVVRLDQNTVLELAQNEQETILTFHQDERVRRFASQANYCGVGYFITRFPRKLKVRTPFYNAVVEGTEFQVALACDRGDLAVFEGKVAAEDPAASQERILVNGGESTSIGLGETPRAIKALVRPADAVQWALYYLPLSARAMLNENAILRDCAALTPEVRSACRIARAEYLLQGGRATEARIELSRLATEEPGNGDVLALQAVIAVVQNDNAAALALAGKATTAAPNSSRAYAALSYAQQASFKLEDALVAAQRAVQLAPDSALQRARVAELALSLGRARAAKRDAVEAVRLDPTEARAHLVLGFVQLAQIDTQAASQSFRRAIELESTEPLARLGLGLARIREGHLTEGREEIEIAVALDPTNSLVRSYVGKAYYEENSKARDALAATQFGLAKTLDPKDPTPWFYDAILKQTQNRPVEALGDLQRSIELNDNRAVYRSQTMLLTDRGERALDAARIYRGMGFDSRAMFEAQQALASDPTTAVAHQFLADAYVGRSRHEIARVSQSLQAQLRQSINAPPVEPELSDDRLGTSRVSVLNGLQVLGPQAYDRLFEKSGLSLQVDSLVGSEDTTLSQILLGAKADRVAFNFGRFGNRSNGFGENQQSEREVYNAFVQATPADGTSIQAEVRRLHAERGDTRFGFDSAWNIPLRVDEDVTNYRIGLRQALSPKSEALLSAAYQDRDFRNPLSGFPATFTLESNWRIAEAQYVYSDTAGNASMGGGHFSGTDRFDDRSFERHITHDIVYFYGLFGNPYRSAALNLGVSYDYLDSENLERRQWNPKLGVFLTPWNSTTLRAARFRSVKRQIVANQTIEPTSVGGFNQFYDDPTGTDVWTSALAVDHKISPRAFAGGELIHRTLKVPAVTQTTFDEVRWRDTQASFYVNYALVATPFLPEWQSALSLGLRREDLHRSLDATGLEGIKELQTLLIPLSVTTHHPSGISLRSVLTYTRQKGTLQVSQDDPAFARDHEVWFVDVDLVYRLPRRCGFVSLGVRNLFDQKAAFVESDAALPRFSRERLVFLQLQLLLR